MIDDVEVPRRPKHEKDSLQNFLDEQWAKSAPSREEEIANLRDAKYRLAEVLDSGSWRVTAPLRACMAIVRRLLRQF